MLAGHGLQAHTDRIANRDEVVMVRFADEPAEIHGDQGKRSRSGVLPLAPHVGYK